MPIKKYIPGTTFGPETIKDMTTAFERIRRVLKLKDPDDPLIEVVAKKVISLASRGSLLRPKRGPGVLQRLPQEGDCLKVEICRLVTHDAPRMLSMPF